MERPKRPGGPLQARPMKMEDGTFRNAFNEPISETEARDQEYSRRFWVRQPSGMREVMEQNIHNGGAKEGWIGVFVDPNGPTEQDREKMSAYRRLAKELGYEVGGYKHNPIAHNVIMELRKQTP